MRGRQIGTMQGRAGQGWRDVWVLGKEGNGPSD